MCKRNPTDPKFIKFKIGQKIFVSYKFEKEKNQESLTGNIFKKVETFFQF